MHSEKRFFSEKMFVPESKFAWKGKKNRQFWKKFKFFLEKTYNGERINKKISVHMFYVAE